MSDAAAYVSKQLDVKVPWSELVGQDHLKKIIVAIVQRLEHVDQAVASQTQAPGTALANPGFTVIATKDLEDLKRRLEVVENTSLQSRIDQLKQSPLKQAAANATKNLRLSDHVLPLVSLKSDIDACRVGVEANARGVDAANDHIAEVAKALEKELAKYATKEELAAVDAKIERVDQKLDELTEKVDKFESRFEAVEKQLEVVLRRVDAMDERIDRVMQQLKQIQIEMTDLRDKVQYVEEELNNKASKEELQEVLDQIEAVREALKSIDDLNQRVDLMDERCDKMEDAHGELVKNVKNWQQEMEDLQLEKQIESLRRELEEAKTGAFVKATARMDAMQQDMDDLRGVIVNSQGQVQINRENIEEIEDMIRESGGSFGGKSDQRSGTRALIEQLQSDVAKLEGRYAEAAQREAKGMGQHEETEARLIDLRGKMEELAQAKADRVSVEMALLVKADKDAVARDTERNLKAVDEALTVMNAGTQGVQQLLEKQENMVQQLKTDVADRPTRKELEVIKERLAATGNYNSPEELQAQAEAVWGRYGMTIDDSAAGMTRPLDDFKCISCNRPLKPVPGQPLPALPLLPNNQSGIKVPYVPRRAASASGSFRGGHEELTDIPKSLRSAGGTGSNPRYLQQRRGSASSRRPIEVKKDGSKLVELVGEDGRVYVGRGAHQRSGSKSPQSPRL